MLMMFVNIIGNILTLLRDYFNRRSIDEQVDLKMEARATEAVEISLKARNRLRTDPDYYQLLLKESTPDQGLLPTIPASDAIPERLAGNEDASTRELRNLEGAMFPYSARSLERLATCRTELINICLELSKSWDITIIQGHRSNEHQQELYNKGLSKLPAGKSKHNRLPSDAVDFVPYEAVKLWKKGKDLPPSSYYQLAEDVYAIANSYGYTLRWGGDWDSDGDYTDQSFNDYAHWEFIKHADNTT